MRYTFTPSALYRQSCIHQLRCTVSRSLNRTSSSQRANFDVKRGKFFLMETHLMTDSPPLCAFIEGLHARHCQLHFHPVFQHTKCAGQNMEGGRVSKMCNKLKSKKYFLDKYVDFLCPHLCRTKLPIAKVMLYSILP